jgi:hypothetical protein
MSSFQILALASDEALNSEYDLFVAALGYESRSTSIARAFRKPARKRAALGFDHNQVLAYEENRRWFSSNDYAVEIGLRAEDFARVFTEHLASVLTARPSGSELPCRIAVDISCFDRRRLACLVDLVRRCERTDVDVDFLYSIADFVPPHPVLGRNEVAGPVHRRFAGRFLDPGRPLALVAGLGYELGKVVGAAEYVQASRILALIPQSPVGQYEEEVVRANKALLSDLPPSDVLRYQLADPRRTVATLDAIVRGLSQSHNVVLLPGGPKMFALCCLLAQTLQPHASVWRVSSGSSISARDIPASGLVVGVRLAYVGS